MAIVVTSISDLWSSQHPVNKHFFHLAGIILYVNPVDDFPQLDRALRFRILIDDKVGFVASDQANQIQGVFLFAIF